MRGSIKIDVRDGAGKPRQAAVTVRGAGGDVKVARVGEVYVADGLIEGDYTVAVGSGGRGDGARAAGGWIAGSSSSSAARRAGAIALGPRDVACDAVDGAVVEAVAFAPQRRARRRAHRRQAGRQARVQRHRRRRRGDAAPSARRLRVSAKFVGGGASFERYQLKRDQTPYPLALRAR